MQSKFAQESSDVTFYGCVLRSWHRRLLNQSRRSDVYDILVKHWTCISQSRWSHVPPFCSAAGKRQQVECSEIERNSSKVITNISRSSGPASTARTPQLGALCFCLHTEQLLLLHPLHSSPSSCCGQTYLFPSFIEFLVNMSGVKIKNSSSGLIYG